MHGQRLIWLDNGATTQKPQAVIDRLAAFYAHENSNVHRGAHTLAARATDAYEAARDKVRRFVNASSTKEIVFVRGATEGINLVAQAWGRRNVRAGDEIVVTWLEHHANIVPWQQLCLETGAKLRVAPVDDRGDILLDEYEKLLGPRTRIVALTMVSNALGTVTPAREMIAAAHRHGALVAGRRRAVGVAPAHRRAGARRRLLRALGPQDVRPDRHRRGLRQAGDSRGDAAVAGRRQHDRRRDLRAHASTRAPPDRFEAGTGNIADAVGLGAAIDYLDTIGLEPIAAHEHELIEQTVAGLRRIPGVRLIGAPRERAGVVSFLVDGCRTEDVGKALDREGIAVRAGHHCAQPILRRFGLEARSGRRSRSTTPPRTSRRCSPRCAASRCRPRAARADGSAGAVLRDLRDLARLRGRFDRIASLRTQAGRRRPSNFLLTYLIDFIKWPHNSNPGCRNGLRQRPPSSSAILPDPARRSGRGGDPRRSATARQWRRRRHMGRGRNRAPGSTAASVSPLPAEPATLLVALSRACCGLLGFHPVEPVRGQCAGGRSARDRRAFRQFADVGAGNSRPAAG